MEQVECDTSEAKTVSMEMSNDRRTVLDENREEELSAGTCSGGDTASIDISDEDLDLSSVLQKEVCSSSQKTTDDQNSMKHIDHVPKQKSNFPEDMEENNAKLVAEDIINEILVHLSVDNKSSTKGDKVKSIGCESGKNQLNIFDKVDNIISTKTSEDQCNMFSSVPYDENKEKEEQLLKKNPTDAIETSSSAQSEKENVTSVKSSIRTSNVDNLDNSSGTEGNTAYHAPGNNKAANLCNSSDTEGDPVNQALGNSKADTLSNLKGTEVDKVNLSCDKRDNLGNSNGNEVDTSDLSLGKGDNLENSSATEEDTATISTGKEDALGNSSSNGTEADKATVSSGKDDNLENSTSTEVDTTAVSSGKLDNMENFNTSEEDKATVSSGKVSNLGNSSSTVEDTTTVSSDKRDNLGNSSATKEAIATVSSDNIYSLGDSNTSEKDTATVSSGKGENIGNFTATEDDPANVSVGIEDNLGNSRSTEEDTATVPADKGDNLANSSATEGEQVNLSSKYGDESLQKVDQNVTSTDNVVSSCSSIVDTTKDNNEPCEDMVLKLKRLHKSILDKTKTTFKPNNKYPSVKPAKSVLKISDKMLQAMQANLSSALKLPLSAGLDTSSSVLPCKDLELITATVSADETQNQSYAEKNHSEDEMCDGTELSMYKTDSNSDFEKSQVSDNNSIPHYESYASEEVASFTFKSHVSKNSIMMDSDFCIEKPSPVESQKSTSPIDVDSSIDSKSDINIKEYHSLADFNKLLGEITEVATEDCSVKSGHSSAENDVTEIDSEMNGEISHCQIDLTDADQINNESHHCLESDAEHLHQKIHGNKKSGAECASCKIMFENEEELTEHVRCYHKLNISLEQSEMWGCINSSDSDEECSVFENPEVFETQIDEEEEITSNGTKIKSVPGGNAGTSKQASGISENALSTKCEVDELVVKKPQASTNLNHKSVLEDFFKEKPCPTVADYKALVKKVGVPLLNIKHWFHNKRAENSALKSCLRSESRSMKSSGLKETSVQKLEEFYNKNPNPSSEEIGHIAKNVHVTEERVKVWFYNKRDLDFDQSQLSNLLDTSFKSDKLGSHSEEESQSFKKVNNLNQMTKSILKKYFGRIPFPSNTFMHFISEKLNLRYQDVKQWFQVNQAKQIKKKKANQITNVNPTSKAVTITSGRENSTETLQQATNQAQHQLFNMKPVLVLQDISKGNGNEKIKKVLQKGSKLKSTNKQRNISSFAKSKMTAKNYSTRTRKNKNAAKSRSYDTQKRLCTDKEKVRREYVEKSLLVFYKKNKHPYVEQLKQICKKTGLVFATVKSWFYIKRKKENIKGSRERLKREYIENCLLIFYKKNKYPNSEQIRTICKHTGLVFGTVRSWFYTKRKKENIKESRDRLKHPAELNKNQGSRSYMATKKTSSSNEKKSSTSDTNKQIRTKNLRDKSNESKTEMHNTKEEQNITKQCVVSVSKLTSVSPLKSSMNEQTANPSTSIKPCVVSLNRLPTSGTYISIKTDIETKPCVVNLHQLCNVPLLTTQKLKRYFKSRKNPTPLEIELLSENLKMNSKCIELWFKNQRRLSSDKDRYIENDDEVCIKIEDDDDASNKAETSGKTKRNTSEDGNSSRDFRIQYGMSNVGKIVERPGRKVTTLSNSPEKFTYQSITDKLLKRFSTGDNVDQSNKEWSDISTADGYPSVAKRGRLLGSGSKERKGKSFKGMSADSNDSIEMKSCKRITRSSETSTCVGSQKSSSVELCKSLKRSSRFCSESTDETYRKRVTRNTERSKRLTDEETNANQVSSNTGRKKPLNMQNTKNASASKGIRTKKITETQNDREMITFDNVSHSSESNLDNFRIDMAFEALPSFTVRNASLTYEQPSTEEALEIFDSLPLMHVVYPSNAKNSAQDHNGKQQQKQGQTTNTEVHRSYNDNQPSLTHDGLEILDISEGSSTSCADQERSLSRNFAAGFSQLQDISMNPEFTSTPIRNNQGTIQAPARNITQSSSQSGSSGQRQQQVDNLRTTLATPQYIHNSPVIDISPQPSQGLSPAGQLNSQQLQKLADIFQFNKNPSLQETEMIARLLDIELLAVVKWYEMARRGAKSLRPEASHNRRDSPTTNRDAAVNMVHINVTANNNNNLMKVGGSGSDRSSAARATNHMRMPLESQAPSQVFRSTRSSAGFQHRSSHRQTSTDYREDSRDDCIVIEDD